MGGSYPRGAAKGGMDQLGRTCPQEAGVEGHEEKGECHCVSRDKCLPSGKLDLIRSLMGSSTFPTPQQTGEVTVEEPSQPSRSWRVMTQESQLWVLGGPE